MAEQAQTALAGRGIRVERGERRILDGAELAVARGETVAIEGASGSGKSTFIRVLATLVEPSAGQVLLDGLDARGLAPSEFRRRVAYLAQTPAMFPGTVAANIGYGPSLRHEVLSSERTHELLARAGLPEEIATREALTLSGGERQRVALARALANAPEVLLLDEPTAALDPATAEQILALIRSLAESGRSVVMVTHVSAHASALGGSRYRCANGRLERIA